MKKCKGSADPKFAWLDLDRYKPAENFTAVEWWANAGLRADALSDADFARTSFAFESIKEDPLAIRIFPTSGLPVEDVSVIEWREVSAYHTGAISDYADTWIKEHGHMHPSLRWLAGPRPKSFHDIVIEHFPDEPGEGREELQWLLQFPHVHVDLAAPDDVIIKSFALWLARKRGKMHEAKLSLEPTLGRKRRLRKFTPNDFNKWVRTKVLAYLDIKIASKVAGEKMPTASELAHLLLPKPDPKKAGVDQTDIIRSQTAVNANELITAQTIHALKQQWMTERFSMLAQS